MSELLPSVIPLDKGLSLQVPKMVAEPGSLLDCENYEQVDFVGQKRVDGYFQYHGQEAPDVSEFYFLTLDVSEAAEFYAIRDGRVVGSMRSGEAPTGDPLWAYIPMDTTYVPQVGDLLEDSSGNEYEIMTVQDPKDLYTKMGYWEQLTKYNERMSGDEIPAGKTIGLHWFRDRLYAVANLAVIAVADTNNIPINSVIGVGTPRIDSVVVDSFAHAGVRNLVIAYAKSANIIGDVNISYNSTDIPLVENRVPLDFVERASLFYAVDAFQSYQEEGSPDPGWRPVQLGWKVNFTEGNSLFGSLPALNQNISGLGVQGPTSTAGNNGRPLLLTQKVNITNKPVQVNGWKSNLTPTSYAIDASLVREVDSAFVYGDAYVEWAADGDPQLGPLVEYPPDATVRITGV